MLTTKKNSSPSEKDFKRILNLIINFHDPNFNYDDYLNHFYGDLRHNRQDLNVEYILFESINTMNKKYDLTTTIASLNAFTNSGEKKYITRLDGLRDRLFNSNFRNNIIYIINSSRISFINLCNNVLNKYQNSYENNYYTQEKTVR